MIPDTLYDLAFQFKKTKLWEKLFDSQLFAVRHADGGIGYCCVMGMMGEHLALALYPGDEGMDSYRLMGRDRSRMNDFELKENMLSQNCVMVSFANKSELRPREIQEVSAYCAAHGLTLKGRKAYPQFQRFRPHYFPWYVDDETDQAHLAEALEAAVEVSERLLMVAPETLGFTEGAPFGRTIPLAEKKAGAFLWGEIALPEPKPVCYPTPEVHDEIILAKLAKSKKRGGEWACDVFMHVNPVSDENDDGEPTTEPKNAPFFPYLLLIVDNRSGMVVTVQMSDAPEDYAENFTRAALYVALENGKPTRILVCNARTHALFSKVAARMDARLVMKEEIPLLEEAKQGFLEHFADGEGEQGDEMGQMMDALRDPKMLFDMPDEMLAQLAQIAEMGALPDDIAGNVRRECNRRGMK